MLSVKFETVTKTYGDKVALSALDLDIEKGSFVSLLGPSGSGKSTTLNLLAGMLRPDEGEIWIDGNPVSHLSPDKRNIAMVFQSYALYPHMSVGENLAFPLRARRHRRDRQAIAEAIGKVAESLGLGDLLDRFPKELSGGQQQRVALGRAMIRNPKVFLLDEPLSNLDVRLRIKMRRDIKDLHDRVGATTIYVTHDQSEALSLSDKVAVFNEGRLQQYASPLEIYEKPVNTFVANFVGERGMNFIEGSLRSRNGKSVFSAPGMELVIPGRGADDAVILGFRMEAIEPARDDRADARGLIKQVELVGPDRVVLLELEGGQEVVCRTDAGVILNKGETHGFVLTRGKLSFFDKQSGDALASAR
ncbi:ABC transporter ATP-binding protein [Aquamicrobium sp. LC103]|uniref:ABC transporter ATP-binding protein n=1 Tax=Aquamicrobium sp. LC103 TaxID=1120658 RepID=UPI00063E8EFD|nr:ABC transporter ATP-binding protein [Aquamicrobium sp. LC103]TKT69249.1 ABC transporter ATP-binding protein [Aquamicrobium sp. LC103]